LRRVSADLHDGPAQLLSLALLLSHALDPQSGVKNRSEKLKTVNSALADSLREIRSISAGLMLPEIKSANLEQVIRTAVQTHTTHTGGTVACDLRLQSPEVPDALKVCCYRFVQEALNNSLKHASGKGQSVTATEAGHTIVLTVSDHGPGLRQPGSSNITGGMGLIGMRDRIETLGGKLEISSSSEGCRLTASFDLREVKQLDFVS
jgi:signal transduction histidine kinase